MRHSLLARCALLPLLLVACGRGGGAGGGDGGGELPGPYEPPSYSEAELLAQLRERLDAIDVERAAALREIFGFAEDGSATDETVGAFRWDPSQDSVYFQLLDEEHSAPLLISNASADGSPEGVTLAVRYEAGDERAVLFGGDPFRVEEAPTAEDEAFAAVVARVIRHLAGGEPTKIVTSQLADTYWFRHDASAEAYLAAHFPD